MKTVRDRNFNKSVKLLVRIRTDRPHGWKHHFRGVVAQVIGYLELMAKRDPEGEWFTWAQVDNILKYCNRYGGQRYSRRAVELALEYLRKLWVVSGIVERLRMNQAHEGQTFSGRIVTPHFAMCESAVNGKYCAFRPNKILPGHKWCGEKKTKNVGRARAGVVIWYGGPVKKKP